MSTRNSANASVSIPRKMPVIKYTIGMIVRPTARLSSIVAVKPTNNAERSVAEQSAAEPTAAEPVERRAETKGNVDQQRTRRTQRRISVSQMLARIRQHIVAVDTQGGNRMRESCTCGSVRGV